MSIRYLILFGTFKNPNIKFRGLARYRCIFHQCVSKVSSCALDK